MSDTRTDTAHTPLRALQLLGVVLVVAGLGLKVRGPGPAYYFDLATHPSTPDDERQAALDSLRAEASPAQVTELLYTLPPGPDRGRQLELIAYAKDPELLPDLLAFLAQPAGEDALRARARDVERTLLDFESEPVYDAVATACQANDLHFVIRRALFDLLLKLDGPRTIPLIQAEYLRTQGAYRRPLINVLLDCEPTQPIRDWAESAPDPSVRTELAELHLQDVSHANRLVSLLTQLDGPLRWHPANHDPDRRAALLDALRTMGDAGARAVAHLWDSDADHERRLAAQIWAATWPDPLTRRVLATFGIVPPDPAHPTPQPADLRLTLEALSPLLPDDTVNTAFFAALAYGNEQLNQFAALRLEEALSTREWVDALFSYFARREEYGVDELNVYVDLLVRLGPDGAQAVAQVLEDQYRAANGDHDQIFFALKWIGFKALERAGTPACIGSLRLYANDPGGAVIISRNDLGLSTERNIYWRNVCQGAIDAILQRNR